MLLAVEILAIRVRMLDVCRGLFGGGGTGGRSGRTGLEHLRVLDERLGDTVPRIVGGSVILILVREIVGNWVGVALLWTLATCGWGLVICLAGLLGGLRVRRGERGGCLRTSKSLQIVVAENVPGVVETTLTGVRVVEILVKL